MGHLDGPLLLTNGGAAQVHPPVQYAVATFDGQGSYLTDGLVFGGSDVLSNALAEEFARFLPETFGQAGPAPTSDPAASRSHQASENPCRSGIKEQTRLGVPPPQRQGSR